MKCKFFLSFISLFDVRYGRISQRTWGKNYGTLESLTSLRKLSLKVKDLRYVNFDKRRGYINCSSIENLSNDISTLSNLEILDLSFAKFLIVLAPNNKTIDVRIL